jgi:putative endonuclease
MTTRRMSVGAAGETLAARFLTRRGARVIDRNVHVGRDEIDLIVEIGGETVAVEVKTGLGSGTRPWESFDEGKNERLRRAVRARAIRRVDLIAVEFTAENVVIRWLPGIG